MLKDVTELRACPDCASANVAYSEPREQIICRDCGLIFEPLTPVEEQRFEKTHGFLEEERSKPAKKKQKTRISAKKKKRR